MFAPSMAMPYHYIGQAHGDAGQDRGHRAASRTKPPISDFDQQRPDPLGAKILQHVEGEMQWEEIEVNQV